MSLCQVPPFTFEPRLRGLLGRGWYSSALDHPLAVLEVVGLDVWFAGVLGHFDVDSSGRLFEVVSITAM